MVKDTTSASDVAAPANSMFTALSYLSGQNTAARTAAKVSAKAEAILLLRLMRTNVITCLEHEPFSNAEKLKTETLKSSSELP
jgi:hypothetical protein